MCFESYMHVACILTKIEVIFQIRGKVRVSEIASRQKSLKDFVDNSDRVAMCIIRFVPYSGFQAGFDYRVDQTESGVNTSNPFISYVTVSYTHA